jgi:uncharacterized protein YciI
MAEAREYLYRIQPTRLEMLAEGPTEKEETVISEHFRHLEALTREGAVVLAGRTLTADESSFGIVIFRAKDEDDALRVMVDDPAVKKGVMRAELFPFRTALMGTPGA